MYTQKKKNKIKTQNFPYKLDNIGTYYIMYIS